MRYEPEARCKLLGFRNTPTAPPAEASLSFQWVSQSRQIEGCRSPATEDTPRKKKKGVVLLPACTTDSPLCPMIHALHAASASRETVHKPGTSRLLCARAQEISRPHLLCEAGVLEHRLGQEELQGVVTSKCGPQQLHLKHVLGSRTSHKQAVRRQSWAPQPACWRGGPRSRARGGQGSPPHLSHRRLKITTICV